MENVVAFTDTFVDDGEPLALGWVEADLRLFKESQFVVGQRGLQLIFRLVPENGRWHLFSHLSFTLLKEVIEDRISARP